MPIERVQAQQNGNGAGTDFTLLEWLEPVIESIVAALPNIIGAAIILLIGWILGVLTGSFVKRLVDRSELDRRVVHTPLGRMMGDSERAVSRTMGKIAKWFVYALAILAAANLLAIPMLSERIATAVTYIPAFMAGLLVIIVGFVLADFIGDMIARTQSATGTRYTRWFADGVKFFLYFTAIVIGLDTMGIDVTLLYIFATALASGLALGIALAVGIGVGWGSKDYVANHMEEWTSKAREKAEKR